ncbi:hypothetical protein ABT337_01285 [Saccharopolyspora hirsuta]|uniref:hypothetical protein n=1 Tax=Saccharopolyspora hirsuta TaxID=1837 RepID=UPI00147843F6|nr:hypothetical protein [Saccharopolyspora hirsuta]
MHRTIARFVAAAGIAAAVLAGAYGLAHAQSPAAPSCGVAENLYVLDVGLTLTPSLC